MGTIANVITSKKTAKALGGATLADHEVDQEGGYHGVH